MEILDIVDERGVPTGETVERETAHARGIRHRTSHVWILRRRNQAVEVLLQKRSLQKDSHPGCYDISSAGHIPAGMGFVESAIRELKEELGICAESSDLVYCGQRMIQSDSVFHGKPFHDCQVSNVYCLWFDVNPEELTLQEEEVSGVLWIRLSECIRLVRENGFPNCIVPEELLMLPQA